MNNNDFKWLRDNCLKLIAQKQKMKLTMQKYEDIIIKYVSSTEDLEAKNEELKCELEELKKEFERYKEMVSECYVEKSPYEFYGVSERDFH